MKKGRVILGDSFRRVVRPGDWIWPAKAPPPPPPPIAKKRTRKASTS